DRMLSNNGIDVWDSFARWVPHQIGDRREILVAINWTDFDHDDQATLALHLVTGHGRASPLIWITVWKDELKDQRNDFEDACLRRLAELVRMHTHDRADQLALRGHPRVRQLAGTPALAHPFGRGPGGAVRVGDVDVAAKADHVTEPQRREVGKQLLIAKAAIGQDGDTATLGHQFGKTPQARILEIVALI